MSVIDTISLGKKIKAYRAECGWSLDKCSEKMGISRRYLSDIERGDKVPKLETLIRMLNVLNASADDVLQDSLVIGYQARCSTLLQKLDAMDVTRRNLTLDVLQFAIDSVEKSL